MKAGSKTVPWTTTDVARLAALYPHLTMPELLPHFPGRTVIALKNMVQKHSMTKAAEYVPAGRIKKGQAPWNKGKHYQPGGNCSTTQFKPGRKSDSALPVGAEREIGGYIWRKVSNKPRKGKHLGKSTDPNWQQLHHIIYQQTHGPIPKGMVIAFNDGNLRNFDPANLEAITSVESMRRNSRHNRYPDDLNRVIAQRIALVRKLNQLKEDAA